MSGMNKRIQIDKTNGKDLAIDPALPRAREKHTTTKITSEAQRLAWALSTYASQGFRLTGLRRAILELLAKYSCPVNIEMLSQEWELKDRCDATTIYRTLMMLKELKIVQQVNVRHKVRHFVLNVPGESFAYLICRSCGLIKQLDSFEGEAAMEHQIVARGYTDLYYELEFHGLCPGCQETIGKASVKIQSRIGQKLNLAESTEKITASKRSPVSYSGHSQADPLRARDQRSHHLQ
jgi:Fe2+ or Zn2+ uptake regulation protein